MARAVAQKCSRQLWTEVRKLRDCKSNLANCIDKKTGSESIAELFSEKYRELYNSVSYEMNLNKWLLFQMIINPISPCIV